MVIHGEDYQELVSDQDLLAVQLSHSESMKSMNENDLAGLVMPSGAMKRWHVEAEAEGVSATIAAFAVDGAYKQLADIGSSQGLRILCAVGARTAATTMLPPACTRLKGSSLSAPVNPYRMLPAAK